MVERGLFVMQFFAILGTGLIAGSFFCFSSFVMPALGRLSPPQGIQAMQSIDITVINPLFMTVLFGTAILSIVIALAGVFFVTGPRSLILVTAAVLYVVGTIGITMVFNVPLNNKLAGLMPEASVAADFWRSYLEVWTRWNSLRSVAALLSCAAFIYALI